MAIKPKCNKCGDELIEFGAILLSPPDEESTVKNSISVKLATKPLQTNLASSND
jgi:hypothetical protein